MTLFHENGHLTAQGLQALAENKLNELQRLEAAEHIDFCDECLEHYLALLESKTLMAPQAPLAKPVLRQLNSKPRRLVLRKMLTVAAAAVLAVGLWGAGLSGFAAQPGQPQAGKSASTGDAQQAESQPRQSVGARMTQATQAVAGGLDNWVGSLFGTRQDEEEEDEQQKQRPQQKQAPPKNNKASDAESDKAG